MSRIDIHFRVDPTNNTLRGRYDPGGAGDTGYVDVTLTSGSYTSLAALCAEVQTQLQTISSEFNVEENDGVVYIDSNDSTDIEIVWLSLPLMRWLGYAANLGGSYQYSAPNTSPGTFVSTVPWDALLGWEWHTKGWTGDHQTGGSIKIGKLRTWQVRTHVLRSELAQFRSLVSYLLRGFPCRFWLDSEEGSAWSYSNWGGYRDLALAPSMQSMSESWADSTVLAHLMSDLDFVVVSQ